MHRATEDRGEHFSWSLKSIYSPCQREEEVGKQISTLKLKMRHMIDDEQKFGYEEKRMRLCLSLESLDLYCI